MPIPHLDSTDIATLQDVLIGGLMIDGVGVGGASWIVESVSGDGVTSAVTVTNGATITGYAYQGKIAGVAQTAPGAAVSFAPWFFVVVSGTVTVGNVVRSVADNTYRLRLVGRTADPLYTTYNAERIAK